MAKVKKMILDQVPLGVTGVAPCHRRDGAPDVYVVSIGFRAKGLCPTAAFNSLKAARKYSMAMWEANPVLIAQGIWRCEADMVDEVWIHRMRVNSQ